MFANNFFARRCLSRFVAILFQFFLVVTAAAAAAVAAVAGRVELCGMHFNAYFVIVAAAEAAAAV